jgi:hypothetical protein
VFATILAMITEEVNSMLLDVRSGKAPLAMTGHILMLNWNQQVRELSLGVFSYIRWCTANTVLQATMDIWPMIGLILLLNWN